MKLKKGILMLIFTSVVFFNLSLNKTFSYELATSFCYPISRDDYISGSHECRGFLTPSDHLGDDVNPYGSCPGPRDKNVYKNFEGAPIKAIANGRLVIYQPESTPNEGYGELVAVIEHDLGGEKDFIDGNGNIKTTRYLLSIYGHIRKNKIRGDGNPLTWSVGDDIKSGDIIGYINDSSYPDGVIPDHNGDGYEHLHLAIRLSSKTIAEQNDPGKWFRGYDEYVNGKWKHRGDFANPSTVIEKMSTTYTSTQLTDNSNENSLYPSYDDLYPQINDNGNIVWQGYNGASWQIYHYNVTIGTTNLSNNANNNYYPQINSNGDVVWQTDDGTDTLLYLYIPTTGEKIPIPNSYGGYGAQINNQGKVVWRGEDGSNTAIYLYDPLTTTTNQLPDSSSYSGGNPQINGNGDVVWDSKNNADSNRVIYFYKFSTNTTINLTTNAYDSLNPQINEQGKVVWQGYDGLNWQIYLYDTSIVTTSVNLSNNFYDNSIPQINNKGDIIWSRYGVSSEIYFYDATIGSINQIPDSSDSMDNLHQINDQGQVIWVDSSTPQMYLYNSSMCSNIPIPDSSNNYFFIKFIMAGNIGLRTVSPPQLNNKGYVVWSGADEVDDGWDDEIFLSMPEIKQTPTGDLDSNGQIDINDITIIMNLIQTGSYDPDADINGDEVINVLDARTLVTMCTNPNCAP